MAYTVKKWNEILNIVSGKNQKNVVNDNGKYPIYGSGGVMGKADAYLCEAGTTIIGRKGTINKPIFVNERFWNVDTAFGISPGDQLLPKFLYYFCMYFNFTLLDKSTTIPSLAKRDLLNIEMPVPTLKEQKRIVARVEELFSKLDKSVDTLKTTMIQLEVYQQVVLKKAFEMKTDWRHCCLGDVLRVLTDYHANGSYKVLKNNVTLLEEPNYAIMIRSTNFEKNDFKDDLKYIDKHAYDFLKKSQLFGGEVLMGKIGNAGRVYYMKDLGRPMSLAMNMFAMRFIDEIDSKFVYYYLSSLEAANDIKKYIRGVGTPTIDKKSVRSIRFRYPSYAAQKQILAEIESQLSVCDSIKHTVNATLQQAETMRQSILKEAFEGDWCYE